MHKDGAAQAAFAPRPETLYSRGHNAPLRVSGQSTRTEPEMPESFSSSTGVLLIAHGSRLQTANDDLVRLAKQLRARRVYSLVEHAFLELAQPSIPVGAEKCVSRGATKVLMMPWFLSAGRHVSDDLARFQAEFTRRYPGTGFVVCPPLGLHPAMLDIILDRLQESDTETT